MRRLAGVLNLKNARLRAAAIRGVENEHQPATGWV